MVDHLKSDTLMERLNYDVVCIQYLGLLKAFYNTPKQTYSIKHHLIWEAFSHAVINVCRLFVHKYPPLNGAS